MLRRTLIAAVSFGLAVFTAWPATAQQSVALAPSELKSSPEMAHAVEHIDQLKGITTTIGRADQGASLDAELTKSIKARMSAYVDNPQLPQAERDLAKKLSEAKDPAELENAIIYLKDHGGVPVDVAAPIAPGIVVVEQVVESKAPAFSIPPSSNGLTPINCPNLYTSLSAEVAKREARFRNIAAGVGRIELKAGDQTPALVGTGFVVDQAKGIVATACHVVDEVAQFDLQTGLWKLPAVGLAPNGDAKLLLDFGETDAHLPSREFQIKSVAYVPNITGCDGALLMVSTVAEDNSSRLPAALPVAGQELQVPTGGKTYVVSIGYPGRDQTGASPVTQAYFGCVRSDAPVSDKFLFGGFVTSDEFMGAYHIQTHVVPTTQGQSGSPVIDITDAEHPSVIGIHVCCVSTASSEEGNICQHRSEKYMQESVSVVDLMKLYQQSQSAVAILTPVPPPVANIVQPAARLR